MTREEAVMRSLTDFGATSAEISFKSGMGITAVRRVLRALVEEKKVRKYPRHAGSLSYTWVYSKVRNKK